MRIILAAPSLALIILILMDAFEAIVLPRRVTRSFRYTRLFYRSSWTLWRLLARRIKPGKRRETFLSMFGPLSLLLLLSTWAVWLILGFGLLQWSLGAALHSPDAEVTFGTYFYMSGVTFFTLGLGDVTPLESFGRVLAVVESGIGFGFMAMIIGYLPVLYQAFSRREVTISLLDARAGSPPSAAQLLLRLAQAHNVAAIDPFLAEWERWSAELLESQLSFPLLSYYRSQHDNQSWLSALTAVLDTCALIIAGVRAICPYQAQLTFAMARHAAVDMALVFKTPPLILDHERLGSARMQKLRQLLLEAGLVLHDEPEVDEKLVQLRDMYEPYLNALADYFMFALPPVLPDKTAVDNWQSSAWMKRTVGFGGLPVTQERSDHFK